MKKEKSHIINIKMWKTEFTGSYMGITVCNPGYMYNRKIKYGERMGHMKKSWGKTIKTILGVLVGNLVLSFAVAAFTVPNGIIMGGATGIGLTISHYFPVNLSLIILAINAVLFVLGAVFLGKKFALTTIISSFIYPIFLSMVQSIPGIDKVTENNAMLAALYGGVILGIGIG